MNYHWLLGDVGVSLVRSGNFNSGYLAGKYGQRRLDCIMDGPSPYESVVWYTELAGGIVGNSNLVHESEQVQLPCKRREDDIQF